MWGRAALWTLGAVLAVAAGIGIAVWRAPHTVTLPIERSAAPEPNTVPPPARPAPMPAPPVLAEAAPPPGLAADQWRDLQRELAGQPAELARIVASLTYADQLQRFRSSRDRTLALALDQGLEERLRQREMSANEARLVKIALLDVLVDDPAQRQAAIQQWDSAHAPTPRVTSAREADFQRRQAQIVAAWSAQPQRDPAALEKELDALRQASFGAPQGGTRP
jgi:hypothetical protein